MVVSVFRFIEQEEVPEFFIRVSRSDMVNAIEKALIALIPSIDLTVPQPASQIADVVASYIYNAMRFQTNLNLQTLTRFSQGAALRQKAYEKGVTVLETDSDDVIRTRVLLKPYSNNTATKVGLEASVLTNDTFISEVIAISFDYDATTGVTTFRPLAKRDGQKSGAVRGIPSDNLKISLGQYLSSEAISVIGQQFLAADPTVTKFYLTLDVTLALGQDFAEVSGRITQKLTDWIDRTYSLGNIIRQQDIYNILQDEVVRISKLNTDNGSSVEDLTAPNDRTAYLGVLGETIVIRNAN